MYSRDYDNDYEPSAPMVEISIRNPHSKRTLKHTLTALVDSGADATMIPKQFLRAIKAPFVGTSKMRGIMGQGQVVQLYLIVVQVGQYTATGIEAIAIDNEAEPIIGRDVLNQFIITLNGPAEVLELQ